MKKNKNIITQPAASPVSEYCAGIVSIVKGNLTPPVMKSRLESFHEKDLGEALACLTLGERKKLYRMLDPGLLAGILEYEEEKSAGGYLEEMDLSLVPAVLEVMDTDDAVAALGQLSREKRDLIWDLLPESLREKISRTASYDEDEIGSFMTSNFILIRENMTVQQAMESLIDQAAKNDNISTLFVADGKGVFAGAVDLKDLIIARKNTQLQDLVMTSFPYVYGREEVDDCLPKLKEYSENVIPVLDPMNRILGVVTAQNLLEANEDMMGEDYAMLGGLTAEEDLNEPVGKSVRKRLPWLIVLLGLGLLVSGVVGSFEAVVSQLTIIMAFQSLILDMAGNVGTQSLAVTIRVLTSDGLRFRQKLKLFSKEIRIGLWNGLILCGMSIVFVGLFIFLTKGQTAQFSFLVSGCIGVSLLLSMLASSAVGTLVPMAFKKIGVDPAVASGPLITTVNDLVAVVCYYGLSWLLLIQMFHLGN